ncbi:MAG TPA: DJ-1/PfpI family protein [Allosphingosinicella sp.]|nr:DJ-1/PfpI family protein [Allosphingosinicella sp.]
MARDRAKEGEKRRVVILVVPPVDELDLVGPAQVFAAANRLSGRSAYRVEIVTSGDDLRVRGEGGLLSFHADLRLAEAGPPFDSVLLVCGLANRRRHDPALSEWLRAAAVHARRLGAVCVGAFLLAEAGLLDGRKATAHWRFAEELARRHPAVRVESAPIWVQDGNLFTSAGISAGIDLALAWVERDLGGAIAGEIARELVLFLRRPGEQNQLSLSLTSQERAPNRIGALLVWIAENPASKLTADRLADRAGMTIRSLERHFAREVGRTPARYVRDARIEAARRQLQTTSLSLEQVARACGFGGADVMRRVFRSAREAAPRDIRRAALAPMGAQAGKA